MFGTKNVDFNYDSSVFKKLELVVKGGKQMLDITNKMQKENDADMTNSSIRTLKFRLVLFCEVSGERFMFEIPYDSSGSLLKNRDLLEKDDLDEYLKRNVNKLYMQGRTSGIAKTEFMEKTE